MTFFRFLGLIVGVLLCSHTIVVGADFVRGQLLVEVDQQQKVSESSAFSGISFIDFQDQNIQSMGVFAVEKISPRMKIPASVPSHIARALTQIETYLIHFDPLFDVFQAKAIFEQFSMVKTADPNYILQSNFVPNDAYYSKQWSLETLEMDKVWELTKGREAVTVAVIDSGVNWQHPDLLGRIWQNSTDFSDNGIDEDDNDFMDDLRGWDFVNFTLQEGYDWPAGTAPDPNEDYLEEDNDPMDRQGHGTHLAGIISAITNNQVGVSGITNCKIIPIRAGYKDEYQRVNYNISFLNSAIYYAITAGADIIVMSLGSYGSASSFERAVSLAIDAGIIVVASAGNDKVDLDAEGKPYIPAEIDGVITVSATNQSNLLSDWSFISGSNYGSAVDFAAPGTYILSTISVDGAPNYGYLNGTSQAAPIVAAAAALVKSVSPNITNDSVYSILANSATDLGNVGRDVQFGHGLVNPLNALLSLDKADPVISFQGLASQNVGSEFDVVVTITDDFVSELLPSASVTYRYVFNGAPTAWVKQKLEKKGTSYSATLLAGDQIDTKMQFYFEATDTRDDRITVLPENAPESYYFVDIIDRTGPEINFLTVQKLDYLDPDGLHQIRIQDHSAISTQDIQFVIRSDEGAVTYSMSHSGLSFSEDELTVDLSQFVFPDTSDVFFKCVATDVLGNQGESSELTLFLEDISSGLQIYGPEGPGFPVLNAPNPFNPLDEPTYFCFQLNKTAVLTFYIYSLNLQLVKRYEKQFGAGYHEELWDGRDDEGGWVPNGIYVLIIKADDDGKRIMKRTKIAVVR